MFPIVSPSHRLCFGSYLEPRQAKRRKLVNMSATRSEGRRPQSYLLGAAGSEFSFVFRSLSSPLAPPASPFLLSVFPISAFPRNSLHCRAGPRRRVETALRSVAPATGGECQRTRPHLTSPGSFSNKKRSEFLEK